ncbi:MAG: EAL domain-containing protein [Planctomycetes bacterium]|nr:EAL domain-containing protein [Planctomycetota bacterium]
MEHAKVLLVDDETNAIRSLVCALRREPLDFDTACCAEEALGLLSAKRYDVVVSDERMPGMQGAELLQQVLSKYPDTVRILLTGHATLEAAARAVNHAHVDRFLLKPCPADEIAMVIRDALATRRRARSDANWQPVSGDAERAAIASRFDASLPTLRLVLQPIFDRCQHRVFAFEALVRCDPQTFATPLDLLRAARALDRTHELHQRLRVLAADVIATWSPGPLFFVNVEPDVFCDEELYHVSDPLLRHASRVVFEVTERGRLESVPELVGRLTRLRALGYRFAIDDVGAGYAGLNSLALIEPEFVKLDREIVTGIEGSAAKQRIVETLVGFCRRSGSNVIAEGIETSDELDTVESLESDLLQGYRLAPPLEIDEARKIDAPRP